MTRVTCGSRVLLFISAWALCGAGPAASQPLSFHATLEPIKVDGRPQQVITRQFKLTLDPNQPETRFKAKVEDWWRSEDGTQSFYAEAGTLRHSCSRWVSLNPVESSIKAGETLTIRITITVPSEMAAGGYWCALTVDEIPDPRSLQSGVGVKFVASVSTGIFVNLGRLASWTCNSHPTRRRSRFRTKGTRRWVWMAVSSSTRRARTSRPRAW
jgi:hypothetical protein